MIQDRREPLPTTFDFARLCIDRGVPVAGPGHRHYRRDWVSTHCPQCGKITDDGFYLGYSERAGVFTCWRCGRENKGKVTVVAALLGISSKDAVDLIREYAGLKRKFRLKEPEKTEELTTDAERRLADALTRKRLVPIGSPVPLDIHLDYIRKRKFDPQELISKYRLRFTHKVGPYKFRIIIPIYARFDNRWQVVSFQGRDVTGLSDLRYKACAQKDELVYHKTVLYNAQPSYRGRVLVVEGVVDAWRMGDCARATFGIAYTQEQVRALTEYEEAIVMYDCGEPQAQAQADKLIWDVRHSGGRARAIDVDTGGRDPAQLEPGEVEEIKRSLHL